ncbi:CheR family methyltransferase [Pedobacter sp. MW01-1-1]|uniref:CheR family methyltransferase n=1 Tax=Pedobacter sp. MW01-1-1 TaxID=3383027 RepID=UPI003FF0C449
MNKQPINNYEISSSELKDLIELIKNIHGFDFGNYAQASLKRRVNLILNNQKWSIFDLKNQLTNTSSYFDTFLESITVNVTEMFRDAPFFIAVKKNILPYLKSYPHIKVWNAGCSTGEELYSFSILFQEENLYDRTFFYGTDINGKVLEKAKAGIYNLQKMKLYSENYLATEPKYSLSNYYTAQYDAALINRSLKKNCLFASHNLVSDNPFNEFQLISCRNVLIYFNTELQNKVIELFYNSLTTFGFLCLGSKETIRDSEFAKRFKIIDRHKNIYQKII